MIKKILVMLSVFCVSVISYTPVSYQFTDFIKEHDKSYSDDDLITRFSIFKDNVRKINEHNTQNNEWKMAVNKFADLTADEFKVKYTGFKPSFQTEVPRIQLHENRLRSFDLPTEWDWTAKGAVTPVYDQGQCGSCWAFSTIESVESAYFLDTGKLVELSAQNLVDCDTSQNEGCNGGDMRVAMDYIEKNGICALSDYKYKAADGTCKKCIPVTKITSYVDVPTNNESALQQAVYHTPVSVAIEADQFSFQFYSSGVLTANCGTNLDHGVLAVGYGTLNGVDYWKVKNSWGSNWGQDGYILLQRNSKQQGGQCGIAMEATYPVV